MDEGEVILPRPFYDRPASDAARDLLGAVLVCRRGGVRVAGRIVETEAYLSLDDPSCHGARGPTERNAPMFGPPGRAYVYLTYGMHWLFNVICAPAGTPEAVLIRALEPLEGIDRMRRRRSGRRDRELCAGPARLVTALGIGPSDNRRDLTQGRVVWVEEGGLTAEEAVAVGPRIGVGEDPRPLRFMIAQSPWLSKPVPKP